MKHKRLNREMAGHWVGRLIQTKGSELQKDLLRHAMQDSNVEFVSFVEHAIANGERKSIYQGDGTIPSLHGDDGNCILDMTPGHMYLMPASDIGRLYLHWRDFSPAEAADPGLWGAITLSEIGCGHIKPVWLAVDNKNDEDRAYSQLDQGIRDDNIKHTDKMVRRILRWMMGPGHMRGAAELYGNCSLAKAWWCGHFAEVCEGTIHKAETVGIDRDGIQMSLQKIWLELADYLAGKLTVVGERNVLGGIALWAAGSDPSGKISRNEVKQVVLGLGQMSSWCVLGIRPPAQILITIQDNLNLAIPSTDPK